MMREASIAPTMLASLDGKRERPLLPSRQRAAPTQPSRFYPSRRTMQLAAMKEPNDVQLLRQQEHAGEWRPRGSCLGMQLYALGREPHLSRRVLVVLGSGRRGPAVLLAVEWLLLLLQRLSHVLTERSDGFGTHRRSSQIPGQLPRPSDSATPTPARSPHSNPPPAIIAPTFRSGKE